MEPMIVIREGTIQEVFDRSEFLEQSRLYCEESGTKAYGKEDPNREAYLELEERGEIIVIRPEKPITVDRMERNTDKLLALYNEGYECASKIDFK